MILSVVHARARLNAQSWAYEALLSKMRWAGHLARLGRHVNHLSDRTQPACALLL